MKKLITTVVLLYGVIFVQAQEAIRSKRVSKSFTVGSNDKVTINNRYGALDIRTWNKNEVKIEVEVKVYGDNTAEAQELLDLTNIKARGTAGEVVLDTKLTEGKIKTGKKWKTEVKTNYLIYMPITNSLNLSHQYGDVNIGDLWGAVDANVQYGNVKAGNLKGPRNNIRMQYGSVNISNINHADIVQQYGAGLTIGNVGTLKLNASYAAVKIGSVTEKANIVQQYGPGLIIGSVGDLELNAAYAKVNIGTINGAAKVVQRYSNLTVGTAGSLTANAQYANVTVSKLRGDGKFTMQYNRLSLNEVTADCRTLDIDCSYLTAVVNFGVNYNASVEVNTSNAGFKYGTDVAVKAEGAGQSKQYTGKIGNGGDARVRVNSRNGNIVFN